MAPNGHNGIRSIDDAVGPDYWRIPPRIGHPGDKREVHDHVLSRFTKMKSRSWRNCSTRSPNISRCSSPIRRQR
ncbi:MAG: hypothetical protein WDN72_10085 [Alphaproteobacteria bacterium]